MRYTRSADTALTRLAEFLGTDVEKSARGRRKVVLERPQGEPVVYDNRIPRVLYALCHAAITDEELGGFGYDLEEVRDAVRLSKEPTKGVAAHEATMFAALTGRKIL